MERLVAYRRAKAGDAAGIESLVQRCVGPWMPKSEIRIDVVRCAQNEGVGVHMVAFASGQVVGHVRAERKAGDFEHVAVIAICVAPEIRRAGVGWSLLAGVEQWAVRNGIMRLEGICKVGDHAAAGLFQKAGYVCEALAMWGYARNRDGEFMSMQQWARYLVPRPNAAAE